MRAPEARPPSDAELLAEFVAHRSDGAFAAMVERHGAMIRRSCLRILGEAHAAEDAAQAVLLVLARRAPEVRGDQLGAWLHGVSMRAAWTARRERANRFRHERAAAAVAPAGDAEEPGIEPLRQRLDAALTRLPPEQHQAIVLCHLEGRSQLEAAGIAGCALGTMATRVQAGLKRLRRELGLRDATGDAVVVALLAADLPHAAAPTVPAAPVPSPARRMTVGLQAVSVALAVSVAALGTWCALSPQALAPRVAALAAADDRIAGGGALPMLAKREIPDFAAHPTIVSVADGAWSSTETWSPARLPHAGDVVAVRTCLDYDLVSDERLGVVAVQRGGGLRMSSRRPARITTQTLLVDAGGVLCAFPGAWTEAASHEIVLADAPVDANDPQGWRGGLIVLGTLDLEGVRRTAFARLASEPHPGDRQLMLATAARYWLPGDELLLPDGRQSDPVESRTSDENERVVVAGGSRDGTVITLAAPLRFPHPARVADLSRAVVVRSEASAGRRGFVWCGQHAVVTLGGVAFIDLGRERFGGRVSPPRPAVCFDHLLGRSERLPGEATYTFDDCVIRSQAEGFADGIVIDGSREGESTDNLVDHWSGTGVHIVDGWSGVEQPGAAPARLDRPRH